MAIATCYCSACMLTWHLILIDAEKKQDISTQATFSPYNVDQDRL